MNPQAPAPLCPKCGRRIAAWKLDHCVYCGQVFPPDLREGFAEPEALKWVERPAIPPEAARQLEMMKIVPMEQDTKARSVVRGLALLSIPVVAVLFYMLWSVSGKFFSGWLVAIVAAGVIGYLGWTLFRRAR
jgi:hypothetical protein